MHCASSQLKNIIVVTVCDGRDTMSALTVRRFHDISSVQLVPQFFSFELVMSPHLVSSLHQYVSAMINNKIRRHTLNFTY